MTADLYLVIASADAAPNHAVVLGALVLIAVAVGLVYGLGRLVRGRLARGARSESDKGRRT